MKLFKYISLSFAALALVSCMGEMDSLEQQTGALTESQFQAANAVDLSKSESIISGMYTKLGCPLCYDNSSYNRNDNYGFIMMCQAYDAEGADLVLPNNSYNYFNTSCLLTTRSTSAAMPVMRYACPYDSIARAHRVMQALGDVTEDTSDEIRWSVGQAYAIRAFSYLYLAPYFQFVSPYEDCKGLADVPIVTLETDNFTENGRASVGEVYELIESDLLTAIEYLEGYERPNKSRIDQQVAKALLARTYTFMDKWEEAYQYASEAAEGFTPASIAEVSVPSFYDIDEHNWIWGYDMTTDLASEKKYATSSSMLRSFSGYAYTTICGIYACINNLLYNKIPDTDVRKGWWVTPGDHTSPLLDGAEWDGVKGNDICDDTDIKDTPFLDYTNVKFGVYSYGTQTNEEDWPFVRVEDMYLIMAAALVRSKGEASGHNCHKEFEQEYRAPSYDPYGRNLAALDEIWFQRRVELWGEGFFNPDCRRLGKPLVRFHDGDSDSNVPDNYKLNMAADNEWFLMRFSNAEVNTNLRIVQNTGGTKPTAGGDGDMRDGVTD